MDPILRHVVSVYSEGETHHYYYFYYYSDFRLFSDIQNNKI